ncbi:F0F1 ATP synthase subunit epsilon [Hyphomonas sp.]|uniref:F0F1 ATP synthase subunit epsilon n=1 Tax=Hyphomonas sp. TaxID=87 RepID=UPI000C35A1CE|nr:F0F1 ATP synthase subunit epsilon [Hyphomonas sp.]MAU66225.1 F0F1 ATP synthase subunit epsilon [Hyphomonas sp.]MBM59509.1 F0F1 ATP synthase subunit epsilon [Hyphomonas sp.]
MTAALKLTVTTPLQIILQEEDIVSLRAEDASGDFGIKPGHTDFLTVIDAGVMRWRAAEGPWRYCALRGGIFSVTGGNLVRIACREAIVSDDLATLRPRVAAARKEALDESKRARAQGVKLYAHAVRRLMHELAAGGDTLGLQPDTDK